METCLTQNKAGVCGGEITTKGFFLVLFIFTAEEAATGKVTGE